MDHMSIENITDPSPARTEPSNVAVQMNIRVPYFYREQLIAEAHRQGMSINRFMVNLLVKAMPPIKP
jgi:hypothetical protein